MRKIIEKLFFISFLSVLASPTSQVFAQEIRSLQELLSTADSTIFYLFQAVIIALALVFFLWGMAIFILNSGNEEKRKEGKQKMFWGIIALTVMVGIWGILAFLQSGFFGGSLPGSPPGF